MTEERNTVYGSDVKELDQMFGMNTEKLKKISTIKGKLKMPSPDIKGDKVDVRILYYRNNDNTTSIFKTIEGAGFRSRAVFLNVEEINAPGIEKDMPLSTSLYQSICRELYNRGLTNPDGSANLDELPGKVLTITADYWFAAPTSKRSIDKKCVKCNGKGCEFCTVAGTGEDAGRQTGLQPPTVYTATIRDDLTETPDEQEILEF